MKKLHRLVRRFPSLSPDKYRFNHCDALISTKTELRWPRVRWLCPGKLTRAGTDKKSSIFFVWKNNLMDCQHNIDCNSQEKHWRKLTILTERDRSSFDGSINAFDASELRVLLLWDEYWRASHPWNDTSVFEDNDMNTTSTTTFQRIEVFNTSIKLLHSDSFSLIDY